MTTWSTYKVIGQRSRSPDKKCNFMARKKPDLDKDKVTRVKTKGHRVKVTMVKVNGSKERQVGSHQHNGLVKR